MPRPQDAIIQRKEVRIMTKIDIISGFLGAGKTTLIKKLLKEALGQEKVVLIENEFGEIGIDGGFLKEAGIQVTEMNSGCICCSLVGDFGTALREVVSQYSPDRIIIEPSGVGKLSDVIKAVQKEAENCDLSLNSFVTVADAKKCRMYMKNLWRATQENSGEENVKTFRRLLSNVFLFDTHMTTITLRIHIRVFRKADIPELSKSFWKECRFA